MERKKYATVNMLFSRNVWGMVYDVHYPMEYYQ
jgi:hypothetical protein